MEGRRGYALKENLVSVVEEFGFYLVRNGEPWKNCNRGSYTIWFCIFCFLLAALWCVGCELVEDQRGGYFKVWASMISNEIRMFL